MADKDFVVKNGLVTGSNTVTLGTALYQVSNGNVGIGNSAPAHKLRVTGNVSIAGAVSDVTTLSSGNTTIIGFANVSTTLAAGNTTITGFANIATTLAAGNTTITGDINVSGNLTVSGTTTFVNTATLDVKDKNITLAKGSTVAATDGAGITVDNTNIGWTYSLSSNTWQSNVGITPSANNSYDLGTSGLRWSTVFANNITATNVSSTDLYGTVRTATQATIDHDSLANFVSNKHIDHTTVSISTANGVGGGGTIAATRNLFVVANNGIVANSTGVWAAAANGVSVTTTGINVLAGNNQLVSNATGVWVDQTKIDHNSLTNYDANRHIDHTAVSITAGNGLTGGGTIAANRTLTAVGANGITITAAGINVLANNGVVSNSSGVFVSANDGIVSNSSGVFVLGNTGLVVNSTGVHVNSSYVNSSQLSANLNNYQTTAGLNANIASYLPVYSGNINAVSIVNSSTFSIGTSWSANSTTVVFGTSTGLQANGSLGTANQALFSNGTTVYWANVVGGAGYYKGNQGTAGSASNANNIFRINANTVSNNITFDAQDNATATGPITVADGYSVVLSEGARVVII